MPDQEAGEGLSASSHLIAATIRAECSRRLSVEPGDTIAPHMAAAVIAALDTAGYAIVPKEPNEPMLDAGLESLGESTDTPTAFIIRDVLFAYRAMVEASVQGYGKRYL